MRIAIFYESRLGRNDGPPLYYLNAMRDMGIDVTHLSSRTEPDKTYGKFDLYLWVDWGEDACEGMLPYKPISMKNLHPSVYITSDTHLGYDYRLNKAKEFDFVFCNQLRAVREFIKDGVNATWLPHAFEPKAYPIDPKGIKKWDCCFVGYVTFEKRVIFLDRIFKELHNFFFGQRLFEECAMIYKRSHISLNTNAVDDLNMRVFEVIGCGGALLTEKCEGLNELCGGLEWSYESIDEAVDMAKWLLTNSISDVSGSLTKEFNRTQTYQHRIKTMMDMTIGQNVQITYELGEQLSLFPELALEVKENG